MKVWIESRYEFQKQHPKQRKTYNVEVYKKEEKKIFKLYVSRMYF